MTFDLPTILLLIMCPVAFYVMYVSLLKETL
jgi:hypothetical protein